MVSLKGNFEFHQLRLDHSGDVLHERHADDPWIGMHRKCFDMMQRLLEYRLKVLHLTPNNAPIVEVVSPWIPANLGEMYEVYHSRVDRGRDPSGFHQLYIWKVLEPHRYYYDDGSERQVDLFGAIEWPFGSLDTTVCE